MRTPLLQPGPKLGTSIPGSAARDPGEQQPATAGHATAAYATTAHATTAHPQRPTRPQQEHLIYLEAMDMAVTHKVDDLLADGVVATRIVG
jgi:hypothetical protein